jgi:hypothetical protein
MPQIPAPLSNDSPQSVQEILNYYRDINLLRAALGDQTINLSRQTTTNELLISEQPSRGPEPNRNTKKGRKRQQFPERKRHAHIDDSVLHRALECIDLNRPAQQLQNDKKHYQCHEYMTAVVEKNGLDAYAVPDRDDKKWKAFTVEAIIGAIYQIRRRGYRAKPSCSHFQT